MSIRLVQWALEQEVTSATAKLLLICMADMADEAGTCTPGSAQLGMYRWASQGAESVAKNLTLLANAGMIRDTGARNGQRRVFVVGPRASTPE